MDGARNVGRIRQLLSRYNSPIFYGVFGITALANILMIKAALNGEPIGGMQLDKEINRKDFEELKADIKQNLMELLGLKNDNNNSESEITNNEHIK